MKRYVLLLLILFAMAVNCHAGPTHTNTCYTATGSAAMAGSFTAPGQKDVKEVRVHLNGASATSENLVISIDSRHGSAYDAVLVTQDMNTVQDLVWSPDGIIHLENNDKILVTWTNTNTKTWGLEIICEK